jgi:glutamine amidotransferase-like uncharacterized protein
MCTSRLSKKRIGLVSVIITILLVSGIAFFSPAQRPLAGLSVSIFEDHGVSFASKTALRHMFEWMGAEVTIINRTSLNNGVLNTTDLLVMPGGCWCNAHCSIQGDERYIVRQYVLDGGAYFGIDGGASYATSYRVGLFNGTLYPDCLGARDFLTEVDVNRDSQALDLSGEPESYTLFYESSGYFNADNMTGIFSICTYKDLNQSCMIVFECGEGRVFLSSPHPEYEEGNLNDGTDYYDTLNDPESEWTLMLKICQWLLRM